MCTTTDFIEKQGDIILTPLFWDCECEENYIHPASEAFCYVCGAVREESPDSRAIEVLKYADTLPEALTALIESAMAITEPSFCSIPF